MPSNVIPFPGVTFVDWVDQVPPPTKRRKHKWLSDDVLYDLKRDNTLPETFYTLHEFRSYLRSQHACDVVMRTAPYVWKRYCRWVRSVGRVRL